MLKSMMCAGAATALALMACHASAQSTSLATDAADFGAREAAQNMDLSPDGNHIVYVGPGPGRASIVLVGDLTTGDAKPVIRSTADPEAFSWCAFAGNDRLVCRYVAVIADAGHLLGFGRLIALGTS